MPKEAEILDIMEALASPNMMDYFKKFPKRKFFCEKRIEGLTLKEIGEKKGNTGEFVRQMLLATIREAQLQDVIWHRRLLYKHFQEAAQSISQITRPKIPHDPLVTE